LIKDLDKKDDELLNVIDSFSTSTKLRNDRAADLGRVVIIRDNPSIEKAEINVYDSLQNVLKQIDILVEQKNPNIQIEIEHEGVIFHHKSCFESILLNLLTNVLK
jgi:signal transduction histidine kinase